MIRTVTVELERDPDDGWWQKAKASVTLDDREPRFGEVPEPAMVTWFAVLPSEDGADWREPTQEDADRLVDSDDRAIEQAAEQCR